MTIIHRRVVSRAIAPTKVKLRGITGQGLALAGEARLDLTIGRNQIRHVCLIAEDMEHDAIVGYDIMKRGGYSVDFSAPKGKSGRQSTQITVNHSVKVAAHSRKLLSLRPEQPFDRCLEVRIQPVCLAVPNVWVSDSICDLDSQGRVLLEVTNDNPFTVQLERRVCLAEAKSYARRRPKGDRTVRDWLGEGLEPTGPTRWANVCQSTGREQLPSASADPALARSRKIIPLVDTQTLTPEQRAMVHQAVTRCPWSFSLEGESLPATSVAQFTIPTGDARPIRKRAYRLPECQKAPLKGLLDKLAHEGIIRPSRSDWSAPLILVPKKEEGQFRVVVDHRGLNELIRRDHYPMPKIDDMLDSLKSARRFTVLDLKSGFHQVPIHPDDIHKTAFICIHGLFEFLRMTEGLASAPSCFQKILETLFADMLAQGVLVYLDDLILYSETDEEHGELIERVLIRLAEVRLSLRPDKCQFFKKQIAYLGHQISEDGIYPLYENIKKVVTFPVPTNKTELKAFLGLTSYYKKFVEAFAQIARPLNKLSDKEADWRWDSEHQEAFEILQAELVNPPILQYPRQDLPFTLFTDASDYCIGAVLSQTHGEHERVVAYGSRSLNKAEKNYSTSEKECLAIVHFLAEYRHYLLGRRVVIETDHAPLGFLNRQQEPKGLLGRWALQLSEFDYEVRYRPGRVNKNADAMSRIPVNHVRIGPGPGPEAGKDRQDEAEETSLSVPNIKRAQRKDEWCASMLDYLRRGVVPDKDDALAKQIVLGAPRYLVRDDGILVTLPVTKGTKGVDYDMQPVIVLPPPLRGEALGWLHDHFSAGHLGFDKTLRKVQRRFFWPRMFTEIEKYTKSCVSCARIKTPPLRRLALHTAYSQATRPLERLIIDFVGPISPAARDGSTVVLVVTDAFSKFAEAYALPNQQKEVVAETLVNQFFCRYGAPDEIHSDGASNFSSHLMKEVYKLFQSKHIKGSAYHPQTQGGVERQNRTLIESIKHYVDSDVHGWHTYVNHAMMAYNSAVHASTLHTPYELFFGRAMRLPLDAIIRKPAPTYKDIDGYREETAARLYASHQRARQHALEAREAQARYYNMKAQKRDFRVGDLVYITNEQKKAKKKNVEDCRKFRHAWIGPNQIIKRISDVVYVVSNVETRKKTTVHENRMKLAFGQVRPLEDGPGPEALPPLRKRPRSGARPPGGQEGRGQGNGALHSGESSSDSDSSSSGSADSDPSLRPATRPSRRQGPRAGSGRGSHTDTSSSEDSDEPNPEPEGGSASPGTTSDQGTDDGYDEVPDEPTPEARRGPRTDGSRGERARRLRGRPPSKPVPPPRGPKRDPGPLSKELRGNPPGVPRDPH